MSALAHGFASARIRASRGLALIVFIIALSHGSFAASQACEDKTITRKSTAKLTRDAREAQLTLDVLVDRDAVVKAALSAKARGNFGGSDNEAKWADVTTAGASLRCEGGEASQCAAWYDCGDATDASGAVDNGVLVATVAISEAVEFDYCSNGGLAEVEVSVDFTVRRCEPTLVPTPRPTATPPRSAKKKRRSSKPAALELTMAIVVLAVAGAGFLLACFCVDRARRAQDRRVDEIMREADEINRKADAAAASPPRSSRSGEV